MSIQVDQSASSTKRRPATKPRPKPSSDPALSHWLDFFRRYHEGNGIRPVALAMGPELVAVTETQTSRYVYEVGTKRAADGDQWMLIAWEIDIPGIRMRDCESREEAMALFERRDIHGPGVATVRLRPDARPW